METSTMLIRELYKYYEEQHQSTRVVYFENW